MPHNDASKNDALSGGIGNAITHVGVNQLTVAPPADGTPGTATNAAATEATGGAPAYARQAVTWSAAGTPAAGQRGNSGALTFDVPAGTYAFFSLWTALTGNVGNFRGYIPFGGAAAIRGFFSVDTVLTTDQMLSVAHGMADGDRVILLNVFAESLPTGLVEGAVYFVVASTANSFKVALTSGGAAVDITAVGGGEGMFQRVVPEVFASQGQITVAANQLILASDGV